jgi:hypothetical protein
VGLLDQISEELNIMVGPDLTLSESKRQTSNQNIALSVSFCLAEELEAGQFLTALQQRFVMYTDKKLIGTSSEERLQEIPEFLRQELSEEQGTEVPNQIDPVKYQLDLDDYDFNPGCYHLLIEVENHLVAYTRLIFEEGAQVMSAREIYDREIDDISNGMLSAEISRLIHPGGSGAVSGDILELQRKLALQMFEIVDKFAAGKGVHHLFAQVHPIHGAIYVENGVFTRKGIEKPCPSVNNAPAVLLHREIAHDLSETCVV